MSDKLALTVDLLNGAKNIPAVFELESVRHNAVRNYMLTTGKNEAAAAMYYERERLLFMKVITGENKEAFAKCQRFTIYSAFVELMVSGRSLNNGEAYIIPYGEVAQFQMGWRGRLEQINEIAAVEYTSEPQVVYTNELDNFEYELGEKPKILKHKPSKDRKAAPAFPLEAAEKGNKIEFVYWVIKRSGETETFIMSRSQVLAIRDQYSKPWINYVTYGGKWQNGNAMKKPFWMTSEEDAFKKTIVKKAYAFIPKTARMKALDQKLDKNYDPETETTGDETIIDYGLAVGPGAKPGAQQPDTDLAGADVGGLPGESVNGGGPQDQGGGQASNQQEQTPTVTGTAKRVRPSRAKAKPEATKQETPAMTVSPGGATVDTETGEEINPAALLPDLGNLDSY